MWSNFFVLLVVGIFIGVAFAAVYGPERAWQAYDSTLRQMLSFPLLAWRKLTGLLNRKK